MATRIELVSPPAAGLTKNACHTIFIYEEMVIIHFSFNSIRTENYKKGL